MLVLTRKQAESIRIGDEVEVIVLHVAKNRVRLGLRCSPDISITRGELVEFEIDRTKSALGTQQHEAKRAMAPVS